MSGEISIIPGFNITPETLIDLFVLKALATPTAKVGEKVITGRELADGAITSDKLSGDLSAQLGVGDGAVTEAKLALGAVTTAKIADGAISASKLAQAVIHDLTAIANAADIVDADEFMVWSSTANGGTGGLRKVSRAILQNVFQTPGSIVNSASAAFVGVAGFNNTPPFPADGTVPQSNEGVQILTLSFTPKYPNSKVLLSFNGWGAIGNFDPTFCSSALFVNDEPDAIAVTCTDSGQDGPFHFNVRAIYQVTSTATITFKVRAGANSTGIVYVGNRYPGTNYGNASVALLTAQEIKQ